MKKVYVVGGKERMGGCVCVCVMSVKKLEIIYNFVLFSCPGSFTIIEWLGHWLVQLLNRNRLDHNHYHDPHQGHKNHRNHPKSPKVQNCDIEADSYSYNVTALNVHSVVTIVHSWKIIFALLQQPILKSRDFLTGLLSCVNFGDEGLCEKGKWRGGKRRGGC